MKFRQVVYSNNRDEKDVGGRAYEFIRSDLFPNHFIEVSSISPGAAVLSYPAKWVFYNCVPLDEEAESWYRSWQK